MSKEDFEGIAQLARENHKNRVAKNPERIKYAIEQFEKNGIEYYLKNEQTGHFHCHRKCDDRLFHFMQELGKLWVIKMQEKYIL